MTASDHHTDDLHITLATPAHADAIVTLIDASQDSRGIIGLAQRFTREQILSYAAAHPCIVALRRGHLVGVLIAQPKPAGGEAGPVTRAMLDTYPGPADAYVYGPIAVAQHARGQGLSRAMADALRERMAGREGILFIDAANRASIRAHERLGAERVGDFTCRGRMFLIYVLRGT